ncbi:hypothetical protein [Lyngbya aestuarii]|uniref:hypothetical protein n=1 Tax=Lyngbya aestuarii TaxID=118322 RepID=UPI00403D9F47
MGSGTRLGLSIGHKIVVRKHESQLRCVSAPGKGTKFIVDIPIREEAVLIENSTFSP